MQCSILNIICLILLNDNIKINNILKNNLLLNLKLIIYFTKYFLFLLMYTHDSNFYQQNQSFIGSLILNDPLTL